jgi:methionine-rich copper-binding protein CopC
MRRLIPAAAIALAMLLAPPVTLGHADLVSAQPEDGATVDGPTIRIVLTFSEALASGSHADVVGANGKVAVTLAPDATNAVTMSGDVLVEPGPHTIQWTSVAGDGDILRGELTFTVTAPPSASPTDAPSATPEASASPGPASSSPSAGPSASAASSPTPSPSTPPDANSSPGSAVIIPIVVALVFVAGVTLWMTRRRPTR